MILLTGAFTASFTGLRASPPATSVPATTSASHSAARVRNPVLSSSGKTSATARMLKKSCMVAAAKARRNSSLRRECPSETRLLVMVVPMLAPMIMGAAISTVSVPAPTSVTSVAVVTEDDCTSTVARMPANSPARGLVTFSSSRSWKPAPSVLMPVSSIEMPTRNR